MWAASRQRSPGSAATIAPNDMTSDKVVMITRAAPSHQPISARPMSITSRKSVIRVNSVQNSVTTSTALAARPKPRAQPLCGARLSGVMSGGVSSAEAEAWATLATSAPWRRGQATIHLRMEAKRRTKGRRRQAWPSPQ